MSREVRAMFTHTQTFWPVGSVHIVFVYMVWNFGSATPTLNVLLTDCDLAT